MNKSRHITFRCTQEQYAKIKQLSTAYDQTVSYIVEVAIDTLYDRFSEHNFPQRKDKP